MVEQKLTKQRNPIVYGVLAGAFLLLIYFLVLSFSNSFSHAISQLFDMWHWIVLLVLGVGTQVGLYIYVKNSMASATIATTEVAAAGGISTGSMIACCAHHLTDILPLLGFSAISLFLVQYQIPFIILGIFSNLVGIMMMLCVMQCHQLPVKNRIVQELFKFNMKKICNWTIVTSIVIVGLTFFFAVFGSLNGTNNVPGTGDAEMLDLAEQTKSENGVEIAVQPIEFGSAKGVRFDIKFTTHQGSLDFKVTDIAVLKDDLGNEYSPISWEGSPTGGHHRSGVVTFTELKGGAKSMTLVLKNIYEVPEREFTWQVK